MTWNRLLSGFVVLIYFILACTCAGGEAGFVILLFCLFPLACIWFGELMGGYTGQAGTIGITASSPGIIVSILGWVLLLMPVYTPIISWMFS